MIRIPRPKSKKLIKDPTQSKRIDDAYLKILLTMINRYRDAIIRIINTPNSRELATLSQAEMLEKARLAGMDYLGPDDMETVSAHYVEKGYMQGITYATQNLGTMGISLQIGMGPADKNALAILKSRNLLNLTSLSADLQSRIAVILSDGFSAGKSMKDIQKDIQAATDIISSRAEKIARTEIMNAVNESAKGRYKLSGVEKVEWLTAQDDRVCHICLPLDGQIFDIDDLPEGGPPAHVNCRCTTLPVLEDITDELKN